MDIGKVITQQLRYCLRGADTPEQTAQVEWWMAKVSELRKHQPSAESVDTQMEVHATPVNVGHSEP